MISVSFQALTIWPSCTQDFAWALLSHQLIYQLASLLSMFFKTPNLPVTPQNIHTYIDTHINSSRFSLLFLSLSLLSCLLTSSGFYLFIIKFFIEPPWDTIANLFMIEFESFILAYHPQKWYIGLLPTDPVYGLFLLWNCYKVWLLFLLDQCSILKLSVTRCFMQMGSNFSASLNPLYRARAG